MQTDNRGLCPRCLMRDAPEGDALAALIEEWVRAIPEDNRADEAVYAARLRACEGCERLAGGTCALCGCYVAFRAAQAAQRCPDVPGKW